MTGEEYLKQPPEKVEVLEGEVSIFDDEMDILTDKGELLTDILYAKYYSKEFGTKLKITIEILEEGK